MVEEAKRISRAAARVGLLAAVTVAVGLLALTPATAQGSGASGLVRLSGLSGICWDADISIEGSLAVELPEGAVVVSTYAVAGGGQDLHLGEESITSTASTSTEIPYQDDIWFGSRWVPSFPYTYVQRTVVTIDGVEVYAQLLEATCVERGGDAVVLLSETFGPGPHQPDDPSDEMAPRFAG